MCVCKSACKPLYFVGNRSGSSNREDEVTRIEGGHPCCGVGMGWDGMNLVVGGEED